MTQQNVGIILNGVTGRMGTNQHLERSLLAILQQGGIKTSGATITPDIILTGRNPEKLKALSERFNNLPYSTDLDALLKNPRYQIYFDAQVTSQRVPAVAKAIAHGKHVYC